MEFKFGIPTISMNLIILEAYVLYFKDNLKGNYKTGVLSTPGLK